MTHFFPPLINAFNSKFGCICCYANINPTKVFTNIVDSIRHCFWDLGVRKIMAQDSSWFTLLFPLVTIIFIFSY